jgi:predicted lipoprotein with Yx(FWY)xxD motif
MTVSRRNVGEIVIVFVMMVSLVTSACSGSVTTMSLSSFTLTHTPPAVYAVDIAAEIGIGTYLVDKNGMTLYWTTKDSVGQSNITGTALVNWPVFYVPDVTVPSSLNASDFSSITRADGSMQTTFKGWPLYYDIEDQIGGSTMGEGQGDTWFVVDPTVSGPTS